MIFSNWLVILTSIAFFYYGITCLYSDTMVREFKRFGMSDGKRRLTGILQLLGATGLLVGIFFPLIGMMATAGLSLLMLLGFGVRLKIKDSIRASLPSFAFMIINAYLFYDFFLSYQIK